MEAIFIRPLSMLERKSVWALTLLTSTTPSASEAILSMYTGTPRPVSPISTTSIDERIGAPQNSSVTPRESRISTCPPAVATHRRHYEGLCLHLLQDPDQAAQDLVYLCDAAASRGERNAHARFDG